MENVEVHATTITYTMRWALANQDGRCVSILKKTKLITYQHQEPGYNEYMRLKEKAKGYQ